MSYPALSALKLTDQQHWCKHDILDIYATIKDLTRHFRFDKIADDPPSLYLRLSLIVWGYETSPAMGLASSPAGRPTGVMSYQVAWSTS
jgi:hypothetical protein